MTYSENLKKLIRDATVSFSNISEASWSLKNSPSKWSKKEILGQLCDSAIFNLQRFESAMNDQKIDVFPYLQEALVNANGYKTRPTNSLIDQMDNSKRSYCIYLGKIQT